MGMEETPIENLKAVGTDRTLVTRHVQDGGGNEIEYALHCYKCPSKNTAYKVSV